VLWPWIRIAKLSASSLANKAIETFLAARAAKRSQIEAALADAEKGEFISGEALDRWIDSWGTEAELPAPEPRVDANLLYSRFPRRFGPG
jgi:predicted transcriptional regulator